MTTTNYRFSYIAELVKKLGIPLTIFDLEATGFRGVKPFGITEVACFSVTPQGNGAHHCHLINPECRIGDRARELTGITDAMVADKETWGVRYAKLFQDIATAHWIGGFNIKSFDCPAVRDVNAKYGYPLEDGFPRVLDVYSLYRKLEKPKEKGGTLQSVAAFYGVKPMGNLHRAAADVELTLNTLDAMIEKHGVDAVLAALDAASQSTADKPAQADKPAKDEALLSAIADNQFSSLAMLAEHLDLPVKSVGLEVGKAIDAGKVTPHHLINEATLEWLRESLVLAPTSLVMGGKLKPLFEHLNADKPVELEFDYVQLRLAMLDADLRWSSLKAVS